MARTGEAETGAAQDLPPLRLSRVFHARRETVFRAWSSAEHLKRWFSPETYTVPEAVVDMRVGGTFDLCMRSPAGEAHWIRGTFVEVTPHTRLVVDMRCTDGAGNGLFRAYTEVNFSAVLGGTQMDVVQSYTLIDPTKGWMVTGAPEGWRTTLDKLEREVARMQGGAESAVRSVVHATFHLERSYDAPVARAWKALTDEAAKQTWFAGPPGRWEKIERHMDVRVGGTERLKGRWEGGVVSTFDAVYHDVIANERLVYSYVMHLDEKKISVSLATIELSEAGGKTVLRVTEQGAFLDGYDDAGSREHGTGLLLDALGESLKASEGAESHLP
ncbi:MAG TPA: SRPBCC family protein [Acetobacteraceae bacterium]|nr:SRPBCC family protein [Acetobacteraceae bacterium]